MPGNVNYLVGPESEWRTDIPTMSGCSIPPSGPGSMSSTTARRASSEYDLRLAPGADPGQIALAFSGQNNLRLAPNGDLVLSGAGYTLRQAAPVAYQHIAGERVAVESSYAIHSNGTVGISLGRFDASRELVIDPVILVYSTFLGGSDFEDGWESRSIRRAPLTSRA